MKSRTILRAAAVFALAFALTTFAVPFSVDAQEFCIQVITFAENPETGECEAFPTPCDVPEGWELCDYPTLSASTTDATESAQEVSHEPCIQVITYAANPGTGECVAFPTPCDVPAGWGSCDGTTSASAQEVSHEPCIQVITYAANPGTGECVAFPTPCDVPAGWGSCDGSTL